MNPQLYESYPKNNTKGFVSRIFPSPLGVQRVRMEHLTQGDPHVRVPVSYGDFLRPGPPPGAQVVVKTPNKTTRLGH